MNDIPWTEGMGIDCLFGHVGQDTGVSPGEANAMRGISDTLTLSKIEESKCGFGVGYLELPCVHRHQPGSLEFSL